MRLAQEVPAHDHKRFVHRVHAITPSMLRTPFGRFGETDTQTFDYRLGCNRRVPNAPSRMSARSMLMETYATSRQSVAKLP